MDLTTARKDCTGRENSRSRQQYPCWLEGKAAPDLLAKAVMETTYRDGEKYFSEINYGVAEATSKFYGKDKYMEIPTLCLCK